MNNIHRSFKSFRKNKLNGNFVKENKTVNEAVVKRDDTFIVGGINIPQKTINAYVRKVKDQTGKDLKSMFSEMEIAQELVHWSIESLDNIDNVPVSALLGGEEEMGEDIDTDTDEEVVDDGGFDGEGEDGETDLDLDEEGSEDDEFESPDLEDDEDIDTDSDEEIELDLEDIDVDTDEDTDTDEDEELEVDLEDEDEDEPELPI